MYSTPTPCRRLFSFGLLFIGLLHPEVRASSKIWDGVIEEGTDTSIRARLSFSPYSSIQGLLNNMTYQDGTYDTTWFTHSELGMLTTNSNKGVWYIDEALVPYEAIRPFLIPGQRFAAFENRSIFYFTHVPARNHESKLGFVNTVGEDFLVIERQQSNTTDWGSEGRSLTRYPDVTVGFNFTDFPNREQRVEIEPDAVVKIDGRTYPWKGWVQPEKGNLASIPGLSDGNQVMIQHARKMRVELDLPNYGRWSEFVNDRPMGTNAEIQGNFYGVMMANETAVRNIQTDPYTWPSFPSFDDASTFPAWLLNGGPEDPGGPVYRGIYENNPHAIVDGYFTGQWTIWRDWLRKGRHYVASTRRNRSAIGSFIMSSENPIAFGEITAIDGNELTLSAPVITDPEHGTVTVSGVQVINLDADAEYFHLGARIRKEGVLQVGQLIKVWEPRPQTIVYNKSLGTHPVILCADGDTTEGGGDLVFTVTRAGEAAGALSIPVTLSGTASASDYSVGGITGYHSATNSGVIEFADGISEVQFTLTPLTDAAIEGTESVTATLQTGTGYVLIQEQASVNLFDGQTDYAPVIHLISPSSATATHGLHPSELQLEVSATDDRAAPISYAWSVLSGPGTVTFDSDLAAATSARFSTHGVYQIRITATDAGNNSSSLDLSVTVLPANQSPSADIWYWDHVFPTGPARVLLSAHESTDSDDDRLTYTWDFGDGMTLEGMRVYHTFQPGIYTVTLTVQDGRGGMDLAQLPVVVEPDPSLVFWEETFDEWTDGTTSDTGVTPWSASGNGISVQGGKLRSSNASNTWTSGSIDISQGEVMVLMDVSSLGELETGDTSTISYRLDSGAWMEHVVLTDRELEDLDGFGTLEPVVIPGLIGTTLEIRMQVVTSRSNEQVFLDNVRVLLSSGLPRLSVSAEGPANEWDPKAAEFVIDRILNNTDVFTAHFSIGGTASGTDYTVSGATSWDEVTRSGTVTFGAGDLEKTMRVTPVNDGVVEGTESLDFRLEAGSGYTLGLSSAQVEVLDAQTNYAPFLTLVNPSEAVLTLASENDTGNLEILAEDDRTSSLTYLWTKISGPGNVVFGSASTDVTTVQFSTYGHYVVRITVTDGEGLSAVQDYAVTVLDSLNAVPTAMISSDVQSGPAPLTVAFDGTGSTDPDLDALTYLWDFGDGASSTEASPSHLFTTQGVYEVKLTVHDGRTGTDTTSILLNVGTPSAPGSIVWQETFADLDSGATVDNGDTAWSLSNTGGALSVLNGEMHGSNLDATFIWTSEAIDISNGTANFTLDLKSPPTSQLEAPDFLRVSYRIDGGTPVTAVEYLDKTTPIGDDWITFVQTGLTGNTLEVMVEMHNTSGAEHYYFDNVTVRVEAAVGYRASLFDSWKNALPAGITVDETKKGFAEVSNGRIQNGLIMAFGIDSLDPSDATGKIPTHHIIQQDGKRYLEIHYRFLPGGSGDPWEHTGYEVQGLRYLVESSTDFATWNAGALILGNQGTDDNGDGTHTQKIRLKLPVSEDVDGKEFLRVRVEPL